MSGPSKETGKTLYLLIHNLESKHSCFVFIHIGPMTLSLVENFKFFGENIGEKCFAFCNNFSLKKYEKFPADGSTEGVIQKFAILAIF